MALELVGGRQGEGGGPSSGNPGEQRTDLQPPPQNVDRQLQQQLVERLAEAERSLAGSRQRLQALVERAAELRRRLNSGAEPAGGIGLPSS